MATTYLPSCTFIINFQFVNQTETWAKFVEERFKRHFSDEDKQRKMKYYGEKNYEDQGDFYRAMHRVFSGGNLGGVRLISAKK